jgi:hypothetical protein
VPAASAAIDAAPEAARLDAFANQLADFLVPLGPVLDVLFAGATLGIINCGVDNSALIEVLGNDGYVNALLPIIMAFAQPLGIENNIVTAAQFNGFAANDYRARIMAVLGAIAEIYRGMLNNPVDSLLSLIPNLAYFIHPDAGNNPSPLQQSIDNLLHPLYMLLDILRPLVDVFDFLPQIELPIQGVLIDASGITVNGPVLIESLVADLLGDLSLPLNINLILANFVLLMPDGSDGWAADKPAVLFALLQAMGMLEFIEENGMEGLTQFIRYGRFPGPTLINYASAPAPVANVVYPDWFIRTHAQFLADNADAVVNWMWNNFIDTPQVIDLLQGLLGNIEIRSSLEETVDDLFGNDVFVRDNLILIAQLLVGLREQLDAFELPAIDLLGTSALSLSALLARLVAIYRRRNRANNHRWYG